MSTLNFPRILHEVLQFTMSMFKLLQLLLPLLHMLLKLRMQVIFTFIITLLSVIRAGESGISSTFVRKALPAIDMPLDSPVFAVPGGYNAPQQVHITQGDYDGRAVIISWITPDDPDSSYVRYGTSPGQYDLIADGRVSNYSFYKYKSGYIHHTHVDGLEYNTKYYYKVGSGNSSREFWFLTPPELGPDVPYKFGIIGDLGQTFNSLSTLEHYMQSGGQAVLYVGDLSYADKYFFNDIGLRWDTWGRFVERSAAYQPWMWSAGNHEIEYFPLLKEKSPFKNYIQRYAVPYNSALNSGNPLWYAVRRASAHIIVLSSYSPFVTYMPQWAWLKEELERVDREKTPWLIILMHIPMYSSNEAHYMEGESMRVAFESWFVEYKVDVVFAGHVHAYERSYRISNILDSSTGNCQPILDKSAPVYITVGDGGNQEGLAAMFKDPQPSFSAFREASYGHSTLEIINRTHALYQWNRNDDGENVPTDSFILRNQYWASSSKKKT